MASGSGPNIFFRTYFRKGAGKNGVLKESVSFPNPGDGIQPFVISGLEQTSSLRSPHEAPERGYQPEWVKTQNQRPGELGRSGVNNDLNFFFRVRTVLDEN